MQHNRRRSSSTSRARLASTTSSLGAGILGAGIGVAAAGLLEGLALPLLAVGLAMHGWGMADARALEQGAARPAWSTALYWSCWIALALIAGYVAVAALT